MKLYPSPFPCRSSGWAKKHGYHTHRTAARESMADVTCCDVSCSTSCGIIFCSVPYLGTKRCRLSYGILSYGTISYGTPSWEISSCGGIISINNQSKSSLVRVTDSGQHHQRQSNPHLVGWQHNQGLPFTSLNMSNYPAVEMLVAVAFPPNFCFGSIPSNYLGNPTAPGQPLGCFK